MNKEEDIKKAVEIIKKKVEELRIIINKRWIHV
jgi:hypothetical protein